MQAEAEPQAESTPSLEYVRASAPVTRRQFRFVVFLTLLNTILLATFICGPSVSSFIRTNWQEYQTSKRRRQLQQQRTALLQQAASYTSPANQIVYEENPFEAAKLLSSSSDYLTVPTSIRDLVYLIPQPWQPPVYLNQPIAMQLQAAAFNPPFQNETTILLHTLKNPKGEDRLIWIGLSTRFQLYYFTGGTGGGGGIRVSPPEGANPRQLATRVERQLRAYIVDDSPLHAPTPLATLAFPTYSNKPVATWTNTGTWENGRIDIDPNGLFRLYAGQVDPADPTHFTIDYAIDGQRNTIDGYLKNNDYILFVPRAGRIVSEGPEGRFWSPFAAPATRPSSQ